MLYQERVLGRLGLWSRVVAGLTIAWGGRQQSDVDLLSMNAHLRRDIGLHEGPGSIYAGHDQRR
jgi:hypothetical protein